MKISLAWCILAGVFACAGVESTPAGAPARFPVIVPIGGVAALPAALGPQVLAQCSRRVPTVESYWEVPHAALAGVDSLVVARLELELAARFPIGSPMDLARGGTPTVYLLQAVGVIYRNQRLVYINGALESVGRTSEDSTRWRDSAVIVCDGGEDFFGLLYDPSRKVLSELEFNGIG